MSQTLRLKFEVAEARGHIPRGSAGLLADATIAEAGVKAAMEGYFGIKTVADAIADVRKEPISDAKAEAITEDIADAYLRDIRPVVNRLNATHTTSDFVYALANLRARTLRAAYEGQESMWRNYAAITTVPNFKPIRGLRFNELPELKLRPESTDVRYTSFSESEDGYRVANYERAVSYTWEMSLGDELGLFTRALESLGRGARRTETLIVFQAIKDGIPRATISGVTAGAPTIDRLSAIRQTLNLRTFTDTEGGTIPFGFNITDLIVGVADQDAANIILNQEFTNYQGGAPNVMAGAFTLHVERLWSRIMGRDYVAFDSTADWLEVAFLEGFQGGPLTFVRLPDEQNHPDMGSFANHTIDVKVGHTLGAKVTEANAAIRLEGAV